MDVHGNDNGAINCIGQKTNDIIVRHIEGTYGYYRKIVIALFLLVFSTASVDFLFSLINHYES